MEIALDEGDIDTALERLKEFGRVERRMGYSYYNYSPIELDVAKAAEESRPRAALAIYQKQAESLIDIRGRENYHEASRFLVKVRDLYRKLGASDEWTSYVTELRYKSRTLTRK